MSWQLSASAILIAALAGAFAWYERSRPDARIVALVATMAALATIGRIAFAPLPNVKPSTDIILISGFALGPAPGLVVGALTGLVSNFFFGQGPWTVWQMTGWAATGAFGALLAWLTRGRVSRWPLALVCMVVGYLFAAFQDVGDWINFSDHSLSQLAVFVGRGTGFDFIHAGGCLMFALLFGPALARSLKRFTERLHVTWLSADGVVGPATAALCLLAAGGLALASAAPARAAASPTSYLLGAQNGDGGYGPAPGAGSSPLYAGWAALGLSAEGVNPGEVSRGGPSLLAYVSAGVPAISDPGSLERTILVARAAGADPAAFGGQNLLGQLDGEFRPDGSISDQVNLTAFGMLAQRAASAPVSGQSLSWLAHQQNSDGGFGFGTGGGASDVDDTGAAIEALADGGPGFGGTVQRAVGFLRASQNSDGGLPAQSGGGSDAQSTAWAVQGFLAAGIDPASVRRGASPSTLDYLRSLIAPDGHVRYSAGSDITPVWVTSEAAMALAERPLPLAPVSGAGGPAGAGIGARGAHGARDGAAAGALGPASTSGASGHHSRRAAAGATPGGTAIASLIRADRLAIMRALGRVLAPARLRMPAGA